MPYTLLLCFSHYTSHGSNIFSSLECDLLSIISSIFTSYVQCLVPRRSTVKCFLKTMEEYKEHLSISLDYGFCYYDTSLENRRIVKLMPSKLIVSTTFLNLILRMTAVVSLSRLTYSTSSSTSNREDRIYSFQMEYGIITYWWIKLKVKRKYKFNFVRDEENIFQMRMNGGLSSEG